MRKYQGILFAALFCFAMLLLLAAGLWWYRPVSSAVCSMIGSIRISLSRSSSVFWLPRDGCVVLIMRTRI